MTNFLIIILIIFYIALNLITAKLYSVQEMKRDFIEGQCAVGKIFANAFYFLAWFLKGVRFIVIAFIK